jgi:hypothetical protein
MKLKRHIKFEALWRRRGTFKIKPLICNYLKNVYKAAILNVWRYDGLRR